MLNRRQCLVAGAALAGAVSSLAATPPLRYLAASGRDLFNDYAVALLGMAIRRANLPCELQAVAFDQMTQGRMEQELRNSDSQLDIMWSMTSRAREQTLCPIRIPLDQGLLGWRVALIRQADSARWQSPPSRPELARRSAGQGLHWPDVEILRANGFRVETAPHTTNLFEMLRTGRIDYFPRSVLEVQDELRDRAHMRLAVAPNLVLHYPTASYAFLSPRHQRLVEPLTEALELLVQDGSMARLFRSHFQSELDSLGLARRQVIALDNPLLSPDTPLQRPELWWRPAA